jgi:hypothetical protein
MEVFFMAFLPALTIPTTDAATRLEIDETSFELELLKAV